MSTPLVLRVGERVEVLTADEIRRTLDDQGTCEGLPFMPEMEKFCGMQFSVYRRSDKICVEGAYMRRLRDTVTLQDVRCDGGAHDGCDRMCFIFWKEAWLRRAEGVRGAPRPARQQHGARAGAMRSGKRYACQSTALVGATTHLSSLDFGQYVRDIASGNYTVAGVVRFLGIYLYNKLAYWRGTPEFGKLLGHRDTTEKISLNLRPGDLVEVKSAEEIAATLDRQGRNRGLHTDWESVRHAGMRFVVERRVEKIILESTGEMRDIENTVILKGTECSGLLRRGCARNCYPFWREAWLRRVEPVNGAAPLPGEHDGGTGGVR